MRKITIDNTTYLCPRTLAECDADQVGLVMMYQLALELYPSGKERVLSKIALLKNLIKVSEKILKKLTPLQMQQLLSVVNWAATAKITGQPFAFFIHNKIKYYLPKPNLADTSAIELAMCSVFQLAMCRKNTPNPNAIFSIIATLCRPERKDLEAHQASPKWDGDCRETYNSIVAEARANDFKTAKVGQIRAIYLYYELMSNAFFNNYDKLLEPAKELPLYQNGEGQITLLMELAEMGTFGSFEDVCRQNVHTIWLFIKDKKLKAERLDNSQTTDDDE